MHPIVKPLLALASLAGALGAAPARAETFNTCAGFIDSLPATISQQGVWCLNKNLSTAITSGAAITIATNNVTIDCNDFKIGGLAAGDSSVAIGIRAQNLQNASVRHCGIRGFEYGILLSGGAGHLVEDNRLDNNLVRGIEVTGDNNRVRRNAVYDTGGQPGSVLSIGIITSADVIDNTVAGVFADAANSSTFGIYMSASGSEARGNQVRGLAATGTGGATGIRANASGITLADNRVSQGAGANAKGLYGFAADTFCTGNTVIGFATAYDNCDYSFGNLPAAP